ncbi:MAG: hypothetical protein H7834_11845 [Magnetococcus sp. YQC-9]
MAKLRRLQPARHITYPPGDIARMWIWQGIAKRATLPGSARERGIFVGVKDMTTHGNEKLALKVAMTWHRAEINVPFCWIFDA